jgi:hypothetical protein
MMADYECLVAIQDGFQYTTIKQILSLLVYMLGCTLREFVCLEIGGAACIKATKQRIALK